MILHEYSPMHQGSIKHERESFNITHHALFSIIHIMTVSVNAPARTLFKCLFKTINRIKINSYFSSQLTLDFSYHICSHNSSYRGNELIWLHMFEHSKEHFNAQFEYELTCFLSKLSYKSIFGSMPT